MDDQLTSLPSSHLDEKNITVDNSLSQNITITENNSSSQNITVDNSISQNIAENYSLLQCTRCKVELDESYFDRRRCGKLYKMCSQCRKKSRAYQRMRKLKETKPYVVVRDVLAMMDDMSD